MGVSCADCDPTGKTITVHVVPARGVAEAALSDTRRLVDASGRAFHDDARPSAGAEHVRRAGATAQMQGVQALRSLGAARVEVGGGRRVGRDLLRFWVCIRECG
jgi:hypothetical protein